MRKNITTVIKSESDKQTEEKSTMNIKYNRRIVEVALENQRNKKKRKYNSRMVQTHNERETICETKIEEQKHSIQSCMEICLT